MKLKYVDQLRVCTKPLFFRLLTPGRSSRSCDPRSTHTHRYIGNSLRRAHEVGVAGDVDVSAPAGRSRPCHLGHEVGIELVQAGNYLRQPPIKIAPRGRERAGGGRERERGRAVAWEGALVYHGYAWNSWYSILRISNILFVIVHTW